MEIEENRGLIDKKAYEDQLASFCLGFALDQERKRRQDKVRSKKGRARSSNYISILCRYGFACIFSLLDLACMVLHVVLCCSSMGFARCDSVFNLALPFLNNHGVMGSSCFG